MLTIESLGKRIAGRKVSANGRCGEILQIDTRYVYVKFFDASAPQQLVMGLRIFWCTGPDLAPHRPMVDFGQ